MSPGSRSLPSANEVVYFSDPDAGVNIGKELHQLSAHERGDLIRVVTRLHTNPESRMDVRGGGPVLAFTYNSTLWVMYWVDTRPRGNPPVKWIRVTILVITVLDAASEDVPEAAFQLAVERYARDVELACP